MKISSIGIGLLMTSVVFAQEFRQLTVKEMINEPGLNSRAYYEKHFTWSPDGKAVFYLENVKDRECLLKLSLDSLKTDTVLSSEKLKWVDDDQTIQIDLSSFIISPDGNKIMLTGSNDIFLYNFRATSIVRMTTSSDKKNDLKFSPDGKWISYLSGHNLWVVNCATKTKSQLTSDGSESLLNGEPDWLYEEEFDLKTGYQWSPDSKMIAFIQINEKGVQRHPLINWTTTNPEIEWQYYPNAGEQIPEARVFVVDIATKKIVEMERSQPKNEYIPRIDWLKDTSLVAIQTINRLQNYIKLSYGNPISGETRVVMEQKDSYWLNVTDLFYFMRNSRNFIFYSELEGFMHLYLHDFSGKVRKALTQGNWMVTDLNGVDENNNLLYFTATKESVLERHVYSVDLMSGDVTRVDNGGGDHSVVFNKDLTHYLDFYSTINTPTVVRLCRNNGKVVKELYRNNDFEPAKYNFGNTKFYKITSTDGDTLYTSLLYPSNFDPKKKYPVLVYVYGGPGVQIVRNRFPGVWSQLLAQQGYLVFSLDNRGSYGRGRNWERRIYQQLGKLELQDQLDGVKFLKSLPYVDADRIGIWGVSYGGYMTLYALTKAPEVFKTGVSIAPVTHWKYYDAVYTERYMGLPKDHQTEYKESAPLNYIDQLKNNFLLIHGTYDDNVHTQQSIVFINEMINKNKQFEMMFYPGRRHGVSDKEGQIHMYEMFLDFIKKNL